MYLVDTAMSADEDKNIFVSDQEILSLISAWKSQVGRDPTDDELARIINNLIDEEISVGDYVLSGGEIPAATIVEGVTRLLPGAADDIDSIINDSFYKGILDHPHYTKPEQIDNKSVPEVLLSGNHQDIATWRKRQALIATFLKRPELLKNVKLSKEDDKLLKEYILENKENEQK